MSVFKKIRKRLKFFLKLHYRHGMKGFQVSVSILLFLGYKSIRPVCHPRKFAKSVIKHNSLIEMT